jgi:hypothetical protein
LRATRCSVEEMVRATDNLYMDLLRGTQQRVRRPAAA